LLAQYKPVRAPRSLASSGGSSSGSDTPRSADAAPSTTPTATNNLVPLLDFDTPASPRVDATAIATRIKQLMNVWYTHHVSAPYSLLLHQQLVD